MKGHEIELKRLLGPGGGDKFLREIGAADAKGTNQVNYIFDTADRRLDRARYALRLREEADDFCVTAKGPSRSVGGSTATRIEIEKAVDSGTTAAILAGRLDPREVLKRNVSSPEDESFWRGLEKASAGRPVKLWGYFKNHRRTIPVTLPGGADGNLEIDRTHFPDGRIDEEIEVEMSDPVLAAEIESWVEEVGRRAEIQTRDSTPKIARFFAALERTSP